MVVNKLYKRKIPRQGNSRREIEREREFLRLAVLSFAALFFLKARKRKNCRKKRKEKPNSFLFFRNSKEILCAFSFSLKLASVSIISGVEFRVRISCFLKLDSSVFGAEIGTKSHSIQIKGTF